MKGAWRRGLCGDEIFEVRCGSSMNTYVGKEETVKPVKCWEWENGSDVVEFSDPHQNSSRAVLDVLEFLNVLVSCADEECVAVVQPGRDKRLDQPFCICWLWLLESVKELSKTVDWFKSVVEFKHRGTVASERHKTTQQQNSASWSQVEHTEYLQEMTGAIRKHYYLPYSQISSCVQRLHSKYMVSGTLRENV